MRDVTKAPTGGAATHTDGHTGALSNRSVVETPDTTNYTTFTWHYLAPWDLDERELRTAVSHTIDRIGDEYGIDGNLVRLHNGLAQLAAEVRQVVESA